MTPLRLAATGTGPAHGPAAAALWLASPTTMFAPRASPAHYTAGLSVLVLAICIAIFLVVSALLVYVLVRYRHRPHDSEREPAQIYGSSQIELSWTVIPILIVVVLFLSTARVIFSTEEAAKPAAALNVVVVGHQYWWEYRYPQYGIVTANELHLPATPAHTTPTYLTMSSADVIHSFWVPRLAGKMDLIPNRVNTMWIDPERPGLYLGQCAQYCGTQHAKMLLRVYADTPEQFSRWVTRERQPAAEDPAAREGRQVFLANACVNCHTISGTPARGTFGPNLTHLAARATFGSGAVPVTPENLRAFVDDPAHLKPGALMPAMHLNQHDLDAVTGYLMTLH